MAFCPPPQGFVPHGEYVPGHWSQRKSMTLPTYYLGNYSAAKFAAEEKEKRECKARCEARRNDLAFQAELGFRHTWTQVEMKSSQSMHTQILNAIQSNPDWYVSDTDPISGRQQLRRGNRLCTRTGTYLPSRCLRRNKSPKRGNTMPLSTFTGYYGDVNFLKRIVMAEFCNLYNIHEDYHD
jgi:hypothetical protein